MKLTARQEQFLLTQFSWFFAAGLFLLAGLIGLRYSLHFESREFQVHYSGHLSKLRMYRASDETRNVFYFSIKEQPDLTFKAAGLPLIDQGVLATEKIGNPLEFSAEKNEIKKAEDGKGDGIPVLQLSSPKNTYIKDDQTIRLIAKDRLVALGISLIFFSVGGGLLFRQKRRFQEGEVSKERRIDPLLTSMAKRPYTTAALSTFTLATISAVVIPSPAGWLIGTLCFAGLGYFGVWFHKNGTNVAWTKEAIAQENQEKAKIQTQRATAAPTHVAAVQHLLKGGDVNVRDGIGHTALQIAAEKGSPEAVDLLLRNGADPNLQDKWGETPLMFAAEKGYLGIVLKLLEAKANVLLINAQKENALAYAQRDSKKNGAIIEILTKATQQAMAAEKAKKEAAANAVDSVKKTGPDKPSS